MLVADDSSVQRQILARLLTQDKGIELAGWAANGAEAVTEVARLRPDVVTLDDRMPVMSGLEAARQIMRETPTPIVMVSAASGDDARRLGEQALAAGVLAVHGKRALTSAEPRAVAELIRLIKGMAEVRVVRQRRHPANTATGAPISTLTRSWSAPEVVAIGASTGGPQVLRRILQQLPSTFAIPVLIVQHTTVGFADSLVDWLRSGTDLTVRLAADGQVLDRAGVYVAPTSRHLIVQGRRLALVDGSPVSLHCPSATVLFRSVAQAYGPQSIGVLLTGMGDDGAAGLLEMKTAGALTLAQDETSSVVFGMPAEAIRRGAVDHVLAPDGIASMLRQALSPRARD